MLQMADIKTAVDGNKHIEQQMYQYKSAKDEEFLKIVVCGAGFTGIELLGALVENKSKYAEIADVSVAEI